MYSLHMRKNIIDIKTNEKLSVREAAIRFGISPNRVERRIAAPPSHTTVQAMSHTAV
jgi:transposase